MRGNTKYKVGRKNTMRDMMSHMPVSKVGDDMISHELIPEGNELSLPDYQSMAEPISPNLDEEAIMSKKDPLRLGF